MGCRRKGAQVRDERVKASSRLEFPESGTYWGCFWCWWLDPGLHWLWTLPHLQSAGLHVPSSWPLDRVSSNPSTPADRALLSGLQKQSKSINTSRQSLTFWPSDRVSSNPSTPADRALLSGPQTESVQIHQHQQTEPYFLALRVSSKASTPADRALLSGPQTDQFKSINTSRQSLTLWPSDRHCLTFWPSE